MENIWKVPSFPLLFKLFLFVLSIFPQWFQWYIPLSSREARLDPSPHKHSQIVNHPHWTKGKKVRVASKKVKPTIYFCIFSLFLFPTLSLSILYPVLHSLLSSCLLVGILILLHNLKKNQFKFKIHTHNSEQWAQCAKIRSSTIKIRFRVRLRIRP